MSSFTPGPWRSDPECGDESVLGSDGAMVADCAIFGMRINRNEQINRANARLIAASPTMLEAFERILASDGMRPGHVEYLSRAEIAAIARDAIAKATGQ